MTDPAAILAATAHVVVVDWPTRDVPDTLARAGLTCTVKSGPAPDDYTAYELRDGILATRRIARPSRADLVYAHRPLAELSTIVELARQLAAKAIWIQSGRASDGTADPKGCWLASEDSNQARGIVEGAGLAYLDHPYIADVARSAMLRR
jgi:hypothetical protein